MVVLTYVFGSSDPWFVIFNLISDLCLVLCCDIYRSTLLSIMYPACMITVHDRKLRVLHYRTSRTPRDTRRCQRRQNMLSGGDDVDVDLHTHQLTLLPTSTEEMSIPPALLFTKD